MPVSPAIRGVTAGALTASPAVPAGTVPGDLIIVLGSERNSAATSSGYSSMPGHGTNDGAVGYLTALYKIATGSDAISLSVSNIRSAVISIQKGTFDATDPFGGSATDTTINVNTSGYLPGITCELPESMILYCNINARDGTDSSAFWSSWVTPNSETFTERFDFISSSGQGTGLGGGTFIRATAGAMGSGSVTNAANGAAIGYTLEIRGTLHPPYSTVTIH